MGTGDGEMWILHGVDITEVSLYSQCTVLALGSDPLLSTANCKVPLRQVYSSAHCRSCNSQHIRSKLNCTRNPALIV